MNETMKRTKAALMWTLALMLLIFLADGFAGHGHR